MLANDLVLNNAAGANVTYRLVSQGPDGSRRIDIAGTMALPKTLVVKHSSSGKAPNVIDRHLVQLNQAVAGALGTPQVTINFTLAVPRDVAVTTQIVHDLLTNFLDFMLDGTVLTTDTTFANVDAIIRGES